MLLYWKPVAEKIKKELQEKNKKFFSEGLQFLAILFFWDNTSSAVYVKSKKKYGDEIWLKTIVYGQEEWKIRDKERVLGLIDELNKNPNCVWIMIQLPLPDNLKEYKTLLLQAITPEKDVDGLWGTLVGKSFFNFLNFIPATPKAVLTLLDYYDLWEVKNKKVAILWQSTIVWKPLALELLKRGAQTACFDINNTPWEIKTYCQSADYIFSATGHIHLIDESYLSWKNNQIIIDIGYWHKDWKAVGDVNRENIEDKVLHLSPVPWGVGPLTIASLFSNIFDLWEQFH